MPMEEALVARLLPVAGDDAVSWFGVQRGSDGSPAYPATAMSGISLTEEWTHEGVNPVAGRRVQMDHYSRDPDAVLARARAVKTEMHRLVEIPDGLGATVRFHPARCERDEPIDEGEQGGGKRLFRVSQDFVFYFEEI